MFLPFVRELASAAICEIYPLRSNAVSPPPRLMAKAGRGGSRMVYEWIQLFLEKVAYVGKHCCLLIRSALATLQVVTQK